MAGCLFIRRGHGADALIIACSKLQYIKSFTWLWNRTITLRHRNIHVHAHLLDSSWNMMAYGDAREGKWRGNWRMKWCSQYTSHYLGNGVSSITTADAHTSAASSRLNWRPRRFKWTHPFRRKTKSGFCACAIIFQTQSTNNFCLASKMFITIRQSA